MAPGLTGNWQRYFLSLLLRDGKSFTPRLLSGCFSSLGVPLTPPTPLQMVPQQLDSGSRLGPEPSKPLSHRALTSKDKSNVQRNTA